MQRAELNRTSGVQLNSALQQQPGQIFFDPVLDFNFYQKLDIFSEKLHLIPDASVIRSCVRMAIFKVRRLQGALEILPAELTAFNQQFLSQPNHSHWTNEEVIHLYALRLLVSNRNQAAQAYHQLDTARDATSSENMIRRHPELFD